MVKIYLFKNNLQLPLNTFEVFIHLIKYCINMWYIHRTLIYLNYRLALLKRKRSHSAIPSKHFSFGVRSSGSIIRHSKRVKPYLDQDTSSFSSANIFLGNEVIRIFNEHRVSWRRGPRVYKQRACGYFSLVFFFPTFIQRGPCLAQMISSWA